MTTTKINQSTTTTTKPYMMGAFPPWKRHIHELAASPAFTRAFHSVNYGISPLEINPYLKMKSMENCIYFIATFL
jgi:hypothetical protein